MTGGWLEDALAPLDRCLTCDTIGHVPGEAFLLLGTADVQQMFTRAYMYVPDKEGTHGVRRLP